MSVTHVVVAISAHDEARRLPRLLRTVMRCVGALHVERPELACEVVLLLDGCTDVSPTVVKQFPIQVVTIVQRMGAEGALEHAVAAGVRSARDDGADPEQVWVARLQVGDTPGTRWLVESVPVDTDKSVGRKVA